MHAPVQIPAMPTTMITIMITHFQCVESQSPPPEFDELEPLVLVLVDEEEDVVAVAALAQKLVNQPCMLDRPAALSVQALSQTPDVPLLNG